MRIKNISFIFAGLCFLALTACSSSVGFRVLDKQTNEDIRDYKVRVQGHGLDKQLNPGEKIKLSNGMFSPPRYTADVEAYGYVKQADYKLQRRFCFFCMKMFGTAGKQTIYLDRDYSYQQQPDQYQYQQQPQQGQYQYPPQQYQQQPQQGQYQYPPQQYQQQPQQGQYQYQPQQK